MKSASHISPHKSERAFAAPSFVIIAIRHSAVNKYIHICMYICIYIIDKYEINISLSIYYVIVVGHPLYVYGVTLKLLYFGRNLTPEEGAYRPGIIFDF